jgi:hypothetical protein
MLKVAKTSEPVLKESNGLKWLEWYEDGIRMIELTGEGLLSDEETETFKAEFLGSDDWKAKATHESPYEILVREDCNVYAPKEASVLDIFAPEKSREEDLADRLFLVFRRNAIPRDLCVAAWKGLRGAARPSKNRGIAGGKVDIARMGRKKEDGTPDEGRIIAVGDGTRAKYVSKDGIVSDTVEANITMGGIAGFFPPTARNPYCRMTAYTRDNFDLFKEAWPFLQEMSRTFERTNPIRFENQKQFIADQNIEDYGWTVPGTVYTTVTVNKNFQTAVHQDKGDLKSGFENFSVLEGGEDDYIGGYTCFPKFRTAFDARTGDFVGMDVAHHWHGNLPMESAVEGKDDWERVSVVLYVREDLEGCGTQEEEQAKYQAWRSKHRNPMEQHEYRKGVHENEKRKDAEFMEMYEAD